MPARIMEQVLAHGSTARLARSSFSSPARNTTGCSAPGHCLSDSPGSPEPVDGSISYYETGACLWAPPTKWGQETRVDVAGVDASARRASRCRSSDWEPSAFENAGVADQHVSQTVVCDTRARAPSGQRHRVSYPVSDSMSCIRREKQHGSETRADTPAPAVNQLDSRAPRFLWTAFCEKENELCPRENSTRLRPRREPGGRPQRPQPRGRSSARGGGPRDEKSPWSSRSSRGNHSRAGDVPTAVETRRRLG